MSQPKRARRTPRPVTEARLERAAQRYLDRYASSTANLRRILMAKVTRSAQLHGTDPDEGAAQVECLLARLTAGGLLDDAAYAAARFLLCAARN